MKRKKYYLEPNRCFFGLEKLTHDVILLGILFPLAQASPALATNFVSIFSDFGSGKTFVVVFWTNCLLPQGGIKF